MRGRRAQYERRAVTRLIVAILRQPPLRHDTMRRRAAPYARGTPRDAQAVRGALHAVSGAEQHAAKICVMPMSTLNGAMPRRCARARRTLRAALQYAPRLCLPQHSESVYACCHTLFACYRYSADAHAASLIRHISPCRCGASALCYAMRHDTMSEPGARLQRHAHAARRAPLRWSATSRYDMLRVI